MTRPDMRVRTGLPLRLGRLDVAAGAEVAAWASKGEALTVLAGLRARGLNVVEIDSLSPSFYVQVTIVNTSTVLMDWLTTTIGGRVDVRQDKGSRPATHKQPYGWRVHGGNAEQLLRAVRPFLVVKQQQAAVALQLRSLHQRGQVLTAEDVAARLALKAEMARLNARGVPVPPADVLSPIGA